MRKLSQIVVENRWDLLVLRARHLARATYFEVRYLLQMLRRRLCLSPLGPTAFEKIHSTRRCKGHLSGNLYGVSGLSKLCDTVVRASPDGRLQFFRESKHPSVVMLYPTDMNYTNIINWLSTKVSRERPVAVVVAGEDQTFPVQIDSRYPSNGSTGLELAGEIVKHESVRRVFAENLDSEVAGVTPIPTGILPSKYSGSTIRKIDLTTFPKLIDCSRLVFVAHRTRSGQQWEARAKVDELASNYWQDFCTILTEEIPIGAYRRQLARHPFTLCVEGGGLDPSPKAFEALLAGSIPIIRHNPASQSYKELPVLFVHEWTASSLSAELLLDEYELLKERWQGKWHEVIHLMSQDYWWRTISRENRSASAGL